MMVTLWLDDAAARHLLAASAFAASAGVHLHAICVYTAVGDAEGPLR